MAGERRAGAPHVSSSYNYSCSREKHLCIRVPSLRKSYGRKGCFPTGKVKADGVDSCSRVESVGRSVQTVYEGKKRRRTKRDKTFVGIRVRASSSASEDHDSGRTSSRLQTRLFRYNRSEKIYYPLYQNIIFFSPRPPKILL